MVDEIRERPGFRRPGTILLGAVLATLIVTAAGAAERVVLGEYFTNQY